jgi:hypothetical protein
LGRDGLVEESLELGEGLMGESLAWCKSLPGGGGDAGGPELAHPFWRRMTFGGG